MDSRGVSAVLGYILVLGITTLLVSGLFFTAGNYVENQHDRAIRAEFEVIGNRIAADIAAVDRLALAAGADGEARLRTDLPPLAAGNSYEISVSQDAGSSTMYDVNLSTTDQTVSVNVRLRAETPVVDSTVSGGDVRIVYNGSHIEVRDV